MHPLLQPQEMLHHESRDNIIKVCLQSYQIVDYNFVHSVGLQRFPLERG